MGTYLLRGITTALLVTVLTLFAGIVWGAVGLGGLTTSRLLDIGLLASCLAGGYRSAKESGEWWMGGLAGAGYVTVGTLLLALFLPIRGWGFVQILAEGAIIGLVIGAVGMGGVREVILGAGVGQGRRSQAFFKPAYAGDDTDDCSSREFEWVPEGNLRERRDPSPSIWLESAEEKSQGACGPKKDPNNCPAVEWSWDHEEGKLLSLEAADSESLLVWGTEQVGNDVIRNDILENNRASRKNTCEHKERDARPWWEE
jgi:hypothetical protein